MTICGALWACQLTHNMALFDAGVFVSPTVLRHSGHRFYFFSREESRMHIHFASSEGEAKFWLEPEIVLASNYRYTARQINSISRIIQEHHHEFVQAWRFHFGD